MTKLYPAPELQILKWLNSEENISLEKLKDKVVMICAFQMLCPGCVEVGLPQAKKVYEIFSESDVAVLGLHTVFEHHAAMREESLKAFLYEYRIKFPVGIDTPSDIDNIPLTMREYALQGTPTTMLIDKKGMLRKKQFGHTPDILLGAEIMALLRE
ncbi:MAG: redoxin domain-containing protein [Rickettsiales bacterium]